MLIFIISKKGNGSQPKKREISPIVKAALAAGERNRIYRAEQEAKAKLNPRFVR